MEGEKPNQKSGKRPEPTAEELEFIFERFATKDPPEEVLEALDSEGFPLRRGIRFIKKREEEFKIAKKVIAKQAEGAYDTARIERRKRHWARLAERSQELLDKLKTFFPFTYDYMLVDAVTDNDDFEFATLLEDFRSYCLLSHIKAELPELENLKSWPELKINDIRQLFSILGLRAENQQFIGKCEVCKDWE
jgi:hypothetical protein